MSAMTKSSLDDDNENEYDDDQLDDDDDNINSGLSHSTGGAWGRCEGGSGPFPDEGVSLKEEELAGMWRRNGGHKHCSTSKRSVPRWKGLCLRGTDALITDSRTTTNDFDEMMATL